MCIPNFKFIAQFGGELCEKQAQKMKEMKKFDQKTTSLQLWRGEMGLKIWDPQKAHLGHLLNVLTCFLEFSLHQLTIPKKWQYSKLFDVKFLMKKLIWKFWWRIKFLEINACEYSNQVSNYRSVDSNVLKMTENFYTTWKNRESEITRLHTAFRS